MTTTTNEANKEEEDDDYDLLYGDVGDFSDDFEERKTTLTTKRSGTTHDAIETGTDGDFAIGKKGRTDEDQTKKTKEERRKNTNGDSAKKKKKTKPKRTTTKKKKTRPCTWQTSPGGRPIEKSEQLAG